MLRFFPGRGNISLVADEIQVNAPDDYLGLPRKTCAILRYAEAARFDFIFLCDTDTFVRPELLLASGFGIVISLAISGTAFRANEKVMGSMLGPLVAGYWLSMQAVSYIAHNQLFEDWAEDRMVGQLLGPHIAMGKLTAVNNRLYGASVERDDLITAHYESRILKRQYDPAWMRALYKRFYPETTCTSKITKPSLSGSPSLPQKCGQLIPSRDRGIAVIDDDTADHHDRELEWQYVMHCGWAAGNLGSGDRRYMWTSAPTSISRRSARSSFQTSDSMILGCQLDIRT